MPRRSTLSCLVVLEIAVACGCAASAHGGAQRVASGAAFSRNSRMPVAAAVEPVAKPGDPVSLRLTPRFATAPGYVRSIIHVTPDADNRYLRVVIDSPSFYRSSDIQLDGASAAESHFIDWKSLPVGRYEFVASVFGSTGLRGERRLGFQVIGPSADR